MKQYIIKLFKNILLQIISLSIIIGMIAFAATITWPTSAPSWGVSWWLFRTELDKIWWALKISGTKVGIGMSTNPTESLEVNGNIKVNSMIDANDTAYFIDPNDNSILKNIIMINSPVNGWDVANKAYVDAKIWSTAISLKWYTEVNYNFDEDIYGAWSDGYVTDTCDGDLATKYTCPTDADKICTDDFQYSGSYSCGDSECNGIFYEKRKINCKKATFLVKTPRAPIPKTLYRSDIVNRFYREARNDATTAEHICNDFVMTYISHTNTTVSTAWCWQYYHYIYWNGSAFAWGAVNCWTNLNIIDTVTCGY